jgi:dihydroorotase/N-acyl-D-amino-acid deacylase
VRVYAKGQAIGKPDAAELDTMRAVVRRAMEDGAFGIGSALIYPPGNYATTDELIEMAKAMSPYGGIYITHMRSEADALLEAIDEAITIGTKGGVPVEIYHLKAAGTRNWVKGPAAIAKIDSARRAGVDVQADMYPYVAGGTGLSACTPPWASENGKLIDNLQNPEMRAKIKAEMNNPHTEWENLCLLAGPEGVLVLGLNKPENKQYAGKRLGEIAKSELRCATGAASAESVRSAAWRRPAPAPPPGRRRETDRSRRRAATARCRTCRTCRSRA